jgi:hypothetical protein
MAKRSKNKSLLKSRKSFSMAQILVFIVAFAAIGTVATWQSFAAPHTGGGKPSHGGTGTISLSLPPIIDNNGDGLPNWSDAVTFNISTTATTQPWVNLLCYQNGVLVAGGTRGFFAGSLDWPNPKFGLDGGGWASGAADCTAYLDMQTKQGMQHLASTSFHVNP